jgi:hypothetical protein
MDFRGHGRLNSPGDGLLGNIVLDDARLTYGGGISDEAKVQAQRDAGEFLEVGTQPAYERYARNGRGLAVSSALAGPSCEFAADVMFRNRAALDRTTDQPASVGCSTLMTLGLMPR